MSGDTVTTAQAVWDVTTAFRTPEKPPGPPRGDRFLKMTDSPFAGLADLTPTRPKGRDGSGQEMLLFNSPGPLAGCLSPLGALQSPVRRGAPGINYLFAQTPDAKMSLEQAASALATPIQKTLDLEALLSTPLAALTPTGARFSASGGEQGEAAPMPDFTADLQDFFNSPYLTNEQKAVIAAATSTPGGLYCDEAISLISGSASKTRAMHDVFSPPSRPGSASKNHQLLVKPEAGALDEDESPQTKALRSLGGDISLTGSAEKNSSGKKLPPCARRRSPGMSSQRRLDFGSSIAATPGDVGAEENSNLLCDQADPSHPTPTPITPASTDPSASSKGCTPHPPMVPKAVKPATNKKGKAQELPQASLASLASMTDPEQAAKAAIELQTFLQNLQAQLKKLEQKPAAKAPEPAPKAVPRAAPAAEQEEAAHKRSSAPNPSGHKRCNCKKSRCLKLYCDCFKAGLFCSDCQCEDCQNNTEHIDIVQAKVEQIKQRNPNAFAEKISAEGDKGKKHRTGCNCKNSSCLKRYCECFQAGVACGDICKCQNCKNQESDREDSGLGSASTAVKLEPVGLPPAMQTEPQPKPSTRRTKPPVKASDEASKPADVPEADIIAQIIANAAKLGVPFPCNMPELQTAFAAQAPAPIAKGRAKSAAGQKRGQSSQQQARPPKVPRIDSPGSLDAAKKFLHDLLAQWTGQGAAVAHPESHDA